MVTTRRGSDLARSSRENKRACNAGRETNESLISGNMLGNSNQDVLSKLSDEVASDLSKRYTVLFACSGIAIERQGYITRFLTSASLVKALKD
ncbi:hypothetical protein QOZ80_5BG0427630 [Eleusine coracana subsp. coracana]|nr:hypothetical protein QOZ80_5BG0427630 [Eleusine coracana subsp. coracana]